MESLGKNGKPVHKSHKSKEQAPLLPSLYFL